MSQTAFGLKKLVFFTFWFRSSNGEVYLSYVSWDSSIVPKLAIAYLVLVKVEASKEDYLSL